MSKHTHFGPRTNARSQALQLLFQAEATGRTVDQVLEGGEYSLSDGPLDPFGERLARGAGGMLDELDAIIDTTSTNWSLRRMPAVDRNLLRVALYEMLEVDEVAVAVTIDESVELAKAYGTDESSRFINGLLGRVASNLEAGNDVVADAMAEEERRHPADRQDQAGDGFEEYHAGAWDDVPEGDATSQEEDRAPVAGEDPEDDAEADDARAGLE